MRNTRLLDALLPKTRQNILATVLLHPEKSWHLSELAQHQGVPSSSLQRELQELSEVGILNDYRQGRMVYYQANADSPIVPELRGLLFKTIGLVGVLADALLPMAQKISLAFVYDSIASGKELSDSDIDLMVVGTVQPVELALPLRRARETLGREINPRVYTRAEFARKLERKDHFLTQVMRQPRLHILGDESEWERSNIQESRDRASAR